MLTDGLSVRRRLLRFSVRRAFVPKPKPDMVTATPPVDGPLYAAEIVTTGESYLHGHHKAIGPESHSRPIGVTLARHAGSTLT